MEVVEPVGGESKTQSLKETSSCECGVRESLGKFFHLLRGVGKKKK